MGPRDNAWESVGVFNPAVVEVGGTVHLLYRALNSAGMSYLGYASSSDGVTIDERSDEPAYWPRETFEGVGTSPRGWSESFASGGGWGGVEDPKLTLIDETVYLTYVAHDGCSEPRIALSSISADDFVNRRWDNWEWPRLISEPGVTNKSGVLLPEKIQGRFVFFHRVFPNILIDHVTDIEELGRTRWLQGRYHIPIREYGWDSRKLSVGATPLRVDDGWLVIYHAVDDKDPGRYKIGAMILDADDPARVISRCNMPILCPEESYENDWKAGIAYPSGALIRDGKLLVYYGGGDKFVCVASADLDEFVNELRNHHPDGHDIDTEPEVVIVMDVWAAIELAVHLSSIASANVLGACAALIRTLWAGMAHVQPRGVGAGHAPQTHAASDMADRQRQPAVLRR